MAVAAALRPPFCPAGAILWRLAWPAPAAAATRLTSCRRCLLRGLCLRARPDQAEPGRAGLPPSLVIVAACYCYSRRPGKFAAN